jgi:hypothetical protein
MLFGACQTLPVEKVRLQTLERYMRDFIIIRIKSYSKFGKIVYCNLCVLTGRLGQSSYHRNYYCSISIGKSNCLKC